MENWPGASPTLLRPPTTLRLYLSVWSVLRFSKVLPSGQRRPHRVGIQLQNSLARLTIHRRTQTDTSKAVQGPCTQYRPDSLTRDSVPRFVGVTASLIISNTRAPLHGRHGDRDTLWFDRPTPLLVSFCVHVT